MIGMVGAGISAVTGLAEMASGIFGKRRRNRRIDEMVDSMPKFQIPTEAGTRLEDSSARLNAQLDELQTLRQDLATQSSNQIQRAQSASGDINDLLAIGTSSQANMSDALRKVQAEGSAMRETRRQNFYNALDNMSEFRQLAYETNELAPWKMKLDLKMQNENASRQMIFGGAQKLGEGLMDFNALGIQAGKTGKFYGNA